jgi:hypothetical protein
MKAVQVIVVLGGLVFSVVVGAGLGGLVVLAAARAIGIHLG